MSTAWRCPHCGAPQPETARCWVCHRSTTCCATCRHFRRAVAGSLGYCGLDRRRRPLHGDELRACWSGSIGPLLAETEEVVAAMPRSERPVLGFVPVEDLVPALPGPEERRTIVETAEPAAAPRPASLGWTLWGDAFL
jgi:hypothetical protein